MSTQAAATINEDFWLQLESHIPEGDAWSASQVAEKFVAEMREVEPGLLSVWLDFNAERFVREELNRNLLMRRSRTRKRARHTRFNTATEAVENNGDTTELEDIAHGLWTQDHAVVVNGEFIHKPFYKLNRSDCLYLAEAYEERERHSRLHVAFYRTVAERLNGKEIHEVFDPEEMVRLYRSITR